MASSRLRAVIAPQARVLNILWGAFLAAPFLYTGLGWLISREPRPDAGVGAGAGAGAGVPVGLLQVVFLLVGTGAVAASYLYPRRALADERLRALLRGPLPGTPPPGVVGLEPVEQRLALLFPRYQAVQIVVLALRESLAVFGLVLVILTGNFLMMVPWSVAAVGLITTAPPRPAEFLDRALPVARAAG
ncbi:MAG: hypothetical protein R6X35_10460 [Candidatus Krumholzibacteriia bacterium]